MKFKDSPFLGHLLALFTILVWGTTMISSKILLQDLSPAELIFGRFFIAFVVLELLPFKRIGIQDKKTEIAMALMGICGVTLYFFGENTALCYTDASNVGVIVTTAPFFTALFTKLFHGGEKLSLQFFIGLVVSLLGVGVIFYADSTSLHVNPLGDLLTLGAACVWGLYTVLSNRVFAKGLPTVQVTRRIFFYGLISMAIVLPFVDFDFTHFTALAKPEMLLNLLFLGLIASALCYLTWNRAIVLLSALKSSVYIYGIPVVTLVFSAIVLDEPFTLSKAIGTVLTILGLVLSMQKKRSRALPQGEAAELAAGQSEAQALKAEK